MTARSIVASALAMVALLETPFRAEGVSASALTAAFLLNFARFAQWPADVLVSGQRLSLCIVGGASVADALELTIRDHAIDGHELTVAIIKPDGALRSCHLVYVTAVDRKQVVQILDGLKGASVLTAGDTDTFTQQGGIAQLILEKERMRFVINVAAADRARIHLSSKLLSLATILKDDHAQ